MNGGGSGLDSPLFFVEWGLGAIRGNGTNIMMELTQHCLSSPDALYGTLLPELRSGKALWLRLRGVGLDDAGAHRGFLTTLVSKGFGDQSVKAPRTLVLDWSTTDLCTAEGIAFFTVVARHFAHRGCRVLACGASGAALNRVLADSGAREASACTAWVPVSAMGQVNVQSLAPIAIFGPARHPSIDTFTDALSARSRECGLANRAAAAVVGVTNEFLHNVLSHGDVRHAAAAALLFTRRRPRVLQIGLADDGVGIPASMQAQPRHAWMADFFDTLTARAVLRGALSGRPEDVPGAFTGGGMTRIVRRLLSDLKATVTLRSGAALLQLHGNTDDSRDTRLTLGHGTQTRIEIPLPERS